MDYAEKDKQNIIEFINNQGGECSVDDIFNVESIERLRIYPLIYRMKEAGIVEITAFSELGSPERIRLIHP